MDAYDAKTGHFTKVSSDDYKGKWTVCASTRRLHLRLPDRDRCANAKYDEFQRLGVEVLAVSVDTKFSHKRFAETEPILKAFQLMMGADGNRKSAGHSACGRGRRRRAARRFLFNPRTGSAWRRK
jgi:peroxiredoxin (alkyl hydroperoxide reductase subunit C)